MVRGKQYILLTVVTLIFSVFEFLLNDFSLNISSMMKLILEATMFYSAAFLLWFLVNILSLNRINLVFLAVFIFLVNIILNSVPYYTVVQNFLTSILYTSIYAGFCVLCHYICKKNKLYTLFISLSMLLLLLPLYSFVQKEIKLNLYNTNESVKKIYIEAGAVIERQKAYDILKQLNDCDKFEVLQKRRIELDQELMEDRLFKEIVDRYK